MPKQKMYLVKREVMAKNIKEAIEKDGEIYAIELVEERLQEDKSSEMGFNKKS